MSRDDDRGRDNYRDGRDRDRGRDSGRDRDRDSGRERGRDDVRSGDRDRDDRSRDRDRDRGGRDDRDRDRGRGRDDRSRDRSSSYTYHARTAEDMDERGAMGNQDFDKLLKAGTKVYKARDGDNRVRLFPATWEGAKHYGLDVYVHYGVGPDRASYLCPDKHGDGDCPVCKERNEVRNDRDADEKYVKDLEYTRRVLVYLVDRDDERSGEQAWMMPQSLDKEISKISVDKDTREVLPIDHPEDGYDVMFDKSGSKLNTKYGGVQIARNPSPLGRRQWLENAMDAPLPTLLKVYDPEHIAKVFGARGVQRDSRDRDDRGRDRDDRGRDDSRDRYRDRDDRYGGGRDYDSRERDRGGRNDEPTWKSVHAMTRTELEDLIELKDLAIKPREAKDDEDLADWVCEEMKLKKAEGGERTRLDEPRDRDRDREAEDRMRDMRRRRDN